MKKTLLLMAAVVASSVAFAQKPAMMNAARQQLAANPVVARTTALPAAAPLKALGTTGGSAFFGRPSGLYYYGLTSDFAGYSRSLLITPPSVEFQFTNGSADPSATTWFINGRDASSSTDENNNLWYATQGAGWYYAPILVNGTDTASLFYTSSDAAAEGALAQNDDEAAYAAFDFNYGFYTGFSGGTFAFGDQTTDGGDAGTLQEYATYQIFDQPASPLYITDIHAGLVNPSGRDIIPAGDTLYAYIYDLDTTETGRVMMGTQELAVFKATQADYGYAGAWSDGTNYAMVKFQNLQDDGFGSLANTPVVVDQPFAIVVAGYNGTGDHFYFSLAPSATMARGESSYIADASLLPGSRMLYADSLGNSYDYGWGYPYYAGIFFSGYQDAIDIPAELTATDSLGNVVGTVRNTLLTAPAEGGEAVNEFDGPLYAYPALAWFDTDGNENYFYDIDENTDEENEWFTIEPNIDYFTSNGVVLLTVTCDPLPDGVTARHAVIHYNGKGVASGAITIRQGDDNTDGITVVNTSDDTKADGALYNLAGQRVGKNAKGIVISNGHKLLNK